MSAKEAIQAIAEPYRAYKQSTNYFLEWLWCQYRLKVPTQADGHHTFRRTSEISAAASFLGQTGITVPASVIAALRKAISKRREVIALYERIGSNDAQHEVFLQTLEHVLEMFISLTGKSDPDKTDIAKLLATNPNPYSSLDVIDTAVETDAASFNISGLAQSIPSQGDSPLASIKQERSVWLEDDSLSVLLEARDFIAFLHQAREQLSQNYRDVVDGTLPLPLAAWLMSEAYTFIEDMMPPNFYNAVCTIRINEKIYNTIFQGHATIHPSDLMLDTSGLLIIADRLYKLAYGDTDGEYLKEVERKKHSPSSHKFTTPWRYRGIAVEVIPEIIDNMRKDIEGGSAILAMQTKLSHMDELRMAPCEPLLSIFKPLVQGRSAPSNMHLIAMDFLVFSSREFLWPGSGQLNKDNCRLRALRLAMQMRASAFPLIAILGDTTSAPVEGKFCFRLVRDFHDYLDKFVREKRFDPYHEAPWVAGNHMNELLYHSYCIGRWLFLHGTVVPGTLHLYNALRHTFSAFYKIPVMEELCSLFLDDAFLGHLPTHNFVSHYRRAVFGCKVRHDEPLSETLEASRLAYNPGTRRRMVDITSIFANQHRWGHRPSVAMASRVHGVRDKYEASPAFASPAFPHRLQLMNKKLGFWKYMDKAREVVLAEFEGGCPVALVNHFAVYSLCNVFMQEFSRLAKPHCSMYCSMFTTDGDEYENAFALGSLLVDYSLNRIVASQRNGQRETSFDLGPRQAIAAFNKIDKNLSLSEMTWTI